jgi:hypothetical protein
MVSWKSNYALRKYVDAETMAILSYVLLTLLREQKERLPKKLTEFKEVTEADIVFGEYDVIARLTSEDLDN